LISEAAPDLLTKSEDGEVGWSVNEASPDVIADAASQYKIVEWHAHSLIVEQRRADITCRRGSGTRFVPSDPGWTASPICSGLICGRHRSRDLRDLRKFKDDGFLRETFTLPLLAARLKAREILNAYPTGGCMAVVENWRQLAEGQIEFTMR
jgi:hypothetical protein